MERKEDQTLWQDNQNNVSSEEQIHHVERGKHKLADFIVPHIKEGKSKGLFMAGICMFFFFFLGLSHIIKKVPPLLIMEEQDFTSQRADY